MLCAAGRGRPSAGCDYSGLDRVAPRATLGGMIKSFKHKGLEEFFNSGSTRGIQAAHANKLRMQLAALDTATVIEDMNIPATACTR